MSAELQILLHTFAITLDDIPALVLQEEPLSLAVECLFVDVMHLLSLDQRDYVQVLCQFALALFEQLSPRLCGLETLRTPFLYHLLAAAAEYFPDTVKLPVDEIELEQFTVQDQFVEEVQLLLLGLHTDVRLLDSRLHKLFHLFRIQVQVVRGQLPDAARILAFQSTCSRYEQRFPS